MSLNETLNKKNNIMQGQEDESTKGKEYSIDGGCNRKTYLSDEKGLMKLINANLALYIREALLSMYGEESDKVFDIYQIMNKVNSYINPEREDIREENIREVDLRTLGRHIDGLIMLANEEKNDCAKKYNDEIMGVTIRKEKREKENYKINYYSLEWK